MSWKTRIKALPLTECVPVITRDGRRGIVTVVLRGCLEPGGEGCEVAWDDGEHLTTGADAIDSVDLLVNLALPHGFGYGLQQLAQKRAAVDPEQVVGIPADVAARHWFGHTTEADRDWLAGALAEVS